MNNNSPDYLTYKKSKINPKYNKKGYMSKTRIAMWVFIITFSVIFAIVVQVIRKYSTRIDIEYGRNQTDNSIARQEDSLLTQGFGSEAKKMIDSRLKLIQLEENAPSEAKVISKEKENDEVINFEQFEKIKESSSTPQDEVSIKTIDTKRAKEVSSQEEITPQASNIGVYSKVLIGKYATFDEARAAQDSVREYNQGSTPFIRKVGDIYALQVGSYQELTTAKQVASKFRAQNFDVWIYQQ